MEGHIDMGGCGVEPVVGDAVILENSADHYGEAGLTTVPDAGVDTLTFWTRAQAEPWVMFRTMTAVQRALTPADWKAFLAYPSLRQEFSVEFPHLEQAALDHQNARGPAQGALDLGELRS